MTLALTPYTITGPAMVNIFAPTPRMKPSAAVNIGHSILQKYLHHFGGVV